MAGLQHLSCGTFGLREDLQEENLLPSAQDLKCAKALLQSRDMLEWRADGSVKKK